MTQTKNDVPDKYDLIIRNAWIVDGSGAPGFSGDVAVTDDRIVAIGDLSKSIASTEFDATNLTLTPGFIDAHAHDDRALLSHPEMTPKVSQGVTTVINGNCGISLAPLFLNDTPPPPLNILGDADWYRFASFEEYLDALEESPASINSACQVGHTTLRVESMSNLNKPANILEINNMCISLEKALETGALGLSTGLAYAPAQAAPPKEMIALARVVHAFNAVYTTHLRTEEDQVLESMEESAELGRKTNVPVILSHHKVAGPQNYGRSAETLSLLDKHKNEIKIGLDVYPYTASSSILSWQFAKDSTDVQISWSEPMPEMSGQMLSAVALKLGCSAKDACSHLHPAGGIYFQMDERDVRQILQYPNTMIGSDGMPHDALPHPRLWGTFPRVLGHYSRDEKLFSLEDAVYRMTGLTALNFGLKDRGIISVGSFADLVVFDSQTIIDTATYECPIKKATGIHRVYVNGCLAWQDQSHTHARAGQVLRQQDQNRPMTTPVPSA